MEEILKLLGELIKLALGFFTIGYFGSLGITLGYETTCWLKEKIYK